MTYAWGSYARSPSRTVKMSILAIIFKKLFSRPLSGNCETRFLAAMNVNGTRICPNLALQTVSLQNEDHLVLWQNLDHRQQQSPKK